MPILRLSAEFLVLLATLVHQGLTFSLYPTVNPDGLASALDISIGCLDAMNTTVNCDDDLFRWTVTVDDHWWEADNLTTLCTTTCTQSAQDWRLNAQLACVNDDLTIYSKLVPAASVASRYTEGLRLACLQSTSSDWCMVQSQSWIGSDVVRPDCTVDPSDPACINPANVTADNARIANLYPDSMLCSDCFIQLFNLRLSSDYLPDEDHSDYLVDQFQDIQNVCSTTVGPISTRYWAGYLDATPIAINGTVPATTATGIASVSATGTGTTSTSAVVTPTPTQIGMVSNCNLFIEAASGDTCYDIATNHSITLTDFYDWNPAVGTNCTSLWVGNYYCVGITLPASSASSSYCQMVDFTAGVTMKNGTLACNQLSLLWNITTGDLLMATGTDGCYSEVELCMPPPCELIQVTANSTCDSMAASLATETLNVTSVQLLSWNPNVIGPCDALQEGQYICAGAPGGSYVPPANAPSDVSGGGQERGGPGGSDPTAITGTMVSMIVTSAALNNNPTAAPAPTQLGINSNCNQYSKAESGDTCGSFALKNKIGTAALYTWNSVLGTDGANCTTEFWANYYYCIGTTSGSAATTTSSGSVTASTTASTTTAAPSPTQSGIISTCKRYVQAQSGDYCSIFASNNGISTVNLYAWNTVLGSNGANCGSEFWAGYYYCIGVSGSAKKV